MFAREHIFVAFPHGFHFLRTCEGMPKLHATSCSAAHESTFSILFHIHVYAPVLHTQSARKKTDVTISIFRTLSSLALQHSPPKLYVAPAAVETRPSWSGSIFAEWTFTFRRRRTAARGAWWEHPVGRSRAHSSSKLRSVEEHCNRRVILRQTILTLPRCGSLGESGAALSYRHHAGGQVMERMFAFETFVRSKAINPDGVLDPRAGYMIRWSFWTISSF